MVVAVCDGLTVMVTLELLLSWESLPVRLRVYVPGTLKVADVATGFAFPAALGNVTVGLPNKTVPGAPIALHVAVSVAPTGKPSSATLPVNVANAIPVKGLILPTFVAFSVNHMLPSGPAVIASGTLRLVGVEYSVITPAEVILPTLFPVTSVNHKLPSGPAVIRIGVALLVGIGNSVITPAVVILPTLFPADSANHRLPSGSAVIPIGTLPAVGIGNSVITPPGVILPTLFPAASTNHKFPSGPGVIP